MPKSSKTKGGKGTSTTAQGHPSIPPPSWPPFRPTLPVVDLTPSLHPLTPRIALVPSFFPRSLCRDYVSFLKTLPLQTTPSRPRRGEAVRVNDRYQIEDPAFAERLWETTGLKETLLENHAELW